MANNLPPITYGELKNLPYIVQEYLRIVRSIVLGAAGGIIAWISVDKTGSNLTDIVTRNHNSTQNQQGGTAGEFYHLTSAQNTMVATLTAGVYTPTLTNVANLDASTAYQCQYMRLGSVVSVSGKVDIDPTLTTTTTQLGISLPVASNIGAQEDCAGVAFASGIAGQGAAIRGDLTNDRAELVYKSVDTTNQSMYFTFTYRVI